MGLQGDVLTLGLQCVFVSTGRCCLMVSIYIYMQHAYASYAHLIEELCTYIPLHTLLSSLPCLPICSDLFPSFPISPWIGPHCGWWFPDLLETSWWTNHLGGIYLECSVQLQVFAGYCWFLSKIASWDLQKFAPCFPDSPVARTVTNPVTNVGKTMS